MSGQFEKAPPPQLPVGTVTFLLTDVAGSTRLWESHGDVMTQVIARHCAIIDEAIAKNLGVRPVEQGEGDSTVAAFARATDAVRAAVDIQRTLDEEAWPANAEPRVRIGIHTGEAHLTDDGTYRGAPLNRCARLRSLGHGGQTLLSRTTADLIRDDLPSDVSLTDLGEHDLRDLARSEHVYQLNHPALPPDFPPLRSTRPRSSTLPAQITNFIGRDRQIQEVARLLEETRLLTLVGAGGCGKTRLAIEVAGSIGDRYRDGVLWIELSSLSDPGLVPSTVASALGIREALIQDPTDTVAAHLEDRSLLLLMDNCEHIAGACAVFAERILRSCRAVTILTTSREPLGIAAETAWRVPSLTLPTGETDDAEQAESVRLFLDRAEKSRPRFRVTADVLDAVVTICRRVDGIPLAIELAAARTRTMSPQQIAKGIGDRFSLLGGGARTALPRQRTLEASVDWSYALLSEPERLLFRRLAIFAGGFALEAAEHVCAGGVVDEFAVLDVLSQLVDRSLVQMEETDDETRYRLLETVRVYARQKLADSEDGAAIRERHLAYFVEFVERAEESLQTREMVAWVARLQRDYDNVRAAMDWSVESRQPDPAFRLCAALFLFWLYGNHLPEGRRRVDMILALEGGDPGLRARALAAAAGTSTFLFDDPDSVRAFAEPALRLAEERGDWRTVGRASTNLGFAAMYRNTTAGRDFFEKGAAAADRAGEAVFVCTALSGLTLVETFLGEHDRALAAAQKGIEVARANGHPFHRAQVLCWDGFRAIAWGEFETARRHLAESIALAQAINDDFLLAWALSLQGRLEVLNGRYEAGRRDLEQATRIARSGGLIFQVGVSQMWMAEPCYAEGDLEGAAAFAEGSFDAMRLAGMGYAISYGLTIFAAINEAQGDVDAARSQAEEALEVARENHLPQWEARALLLISRLDMAAGSSERGEETLYRALGIATPSKLALETIDVLEQIAGVAYSRESFAEGARLLGATTAARLAMGYPIQPIRQDEHDRRVGALRDALGAEPFDGAWSEGTALSLEEAVAYATRARGERKRPSHGWSSLTPTELDVVRHLREGLTNPQIAERMFIARGTVKVHLEHVFAKLGVKTRSELAAQATRRGI